MIEYLKEELDNKDKQLFLVIDEEKAQNQDWILKSANCCDNLQEREAEVLLLKEIASDDVNVTINEGGF